MNFMIFSFQCHSSFLIFIGVDDKIGIQNRYSKFVVFFKERRASKQIIDNKEVASGHVKFRLDRAILCPAARIYCFVYYDTGPPESVSKSHATGMTLKMPPDLNWDVSSPLVKLIVYNRPWKIMMVPESSCQNRFLTSYI